MSFKYIKPKFLDNDKLSLSKNLTIPKQNLKLKTKNDLNEQLKYILLVYVSNDNRKFIDKSAAYALNLTNVRSIMVDGDLNLFEISDSQLSVIKNRNFEIEYRQILREYTPKRPSIEVFSDGVDSYIKLSSAYSLGLISDENFYKMDQQFYKIGENVLAFLNNKYDVVKTTIENDIDEENMCK